MVYASTLTQRILSYALRGCGDDLSVQGIVAGVIWVITLGSRWGWSFGWEGLLVKLRNIWGVCPPSRPGGMHAAFHHESYIDHPCAGWPPLGRWCGTSQSPSSSPQSSPGYQGRRRWGFLASSGGAPSPARYRSPSTSPRGGGPHASTCAASMSTRTHSDTYNGTALFFPCIRYTLFPLLWMCFRSVCPTSTGNDVARMFA